MNRYGYTLIEALFAFFLFSIICLSLIPILHQLENKYAEVQQELELQRTLYFYLKENPLERRTEYGHFTIYTTHQKVCITHMQTNATYCYKF